MSFAGQLTHTCTIEQPALTKDTHNNDVRTFGPLRYDVPCRLVMKSQRVASDDKTSFLTLTGYLLLVQADEPLSPGDRISDVHYEDDTLDTRSFIVESVLLRRSGYMTHRSATLRVAGGAQR